MINILYRDFSCSIYYIFSIPLCTLGVKWSSLSCWRRLRYPTYSAFFTTMKSWVDCSMTNKLSSCTRGASSFYNNTYNVYLLFCFYNYDNADWLFYMLWKWTSNVHGRDLGWLDLCQNPLALLFHCPGPRRQFFSVLGFSCLFLQSLHKVLVRSWMWKNYMLLLLSGAHYQPVVRNVSGDIIDCVTITVLIVQALLVLWFLWI